MKSSGVAPKMQWLFIYCLPTSKMTLDSFSQIWSGALLCVLLWFEIRLVCDCAQPFDNDPDFEITRSFMPDVYCLACCMIGRCGVIEYGNTKSNTNVQTAVTHD